MVSNIHRISKNRKEIKCRYRLTSPTYRTPPVTTPTYTPPDSRAPPAVTPTSPAPRYQYLPNRVEAASACARDILLRCRRYPSPSRYYLGPVVEVGFVRGPWCRRPIGSGRHGISTMDEGRCYLSLRGRVGL